MLVTQGNSSSVGNQFSRFPLSPLSSAPLTQGVHWSVVQLTVAVRSECEGEEVILVALIYRYFNNGNEW